MNSSSQIPKDYDTLKEKYIDVATKNSKLELENIWFRKQFFGTKSERLHSDPDQLELGIEGENTSIPKKTEFEEQTVVKKARNRPPKTHNGTLGSEVQ